MNKEYKIIDPWNIKDRKKLDRDGIDLLLEKILSDVERIILSNIQSHHRKIKKGSMVREDFIPVLLAHLNEDLKKVIRWRFIGDKDEGQI